MSKKTLALLGGVVLVVGLVLGAVLFSGSDSPNLPDPEAPAGEITNVVYEFTEGAKIGDTHQLVVTLKLEQGEQVKTVKVSSKTGGRDVEVIDASFSTVADPRVSGSTGTASSSFLGWMGTSSVATLAGGAGLSTMDDGGYIASDTPVTNTVKNLPFGGILGGLHIATSSPATTTLASDLKLDLTGVDNDQASASRQVSSSSYLYLLLTAGYDQAVGVGCDATNELIYVENQCESATSTNRGFNVVGRFILHLL